MIDEPVIITGGSLEVAISDKFRENGQGNGKKKYRLDNHKLLRLKISNGTVITLGPTDTVTIVCDDGAGGSQQQP